MNTKLVIRVAKLIELFEMALAMGAHDGVVVFRIWQNILRVLQPQIRLDIELVMLSARLWSRLVEERKW